MGLAMAEKARKRQASRIINMKEGDANTRFFHLKMNSRKRKNFQFCRNRVAGRLHMKRKKK